MRSLTARKSRWRLVLDALQQARDTAAVPAAQKQQDMTSKPIKRWWCGMLVSLFPLGCLALSQTKESARAAADYVFCGRVNSMNAPGAKALSQNDVLMMASLEMLHQHKGRALTAKTVAVYYEVSAGTVIWCCPPEVSLKIGQAYMFAACTNRLKDFPGEMYVPCGDFIDTTNACPGATVQWHKAGLADSEALAAAICSGSSRLEKRQVKPTELVPLLRDESVIYKDDDGTCITVRDMALTMLGTAAIVKLPFKKYSNKLICGCQIQGEWHRVHVLTLTDEQFEVVIRVIQ